MYKNQYEKGHAHCQNITCYKRLGYEPGPGNRTYQKYCGRSCYIAAKERRARELEPRRTIPVQEALKKVEEVLEKHGIFDLIKSRYLLSVAIETALSSKPTPAQDQRHGIERDEAGKIVERRVYDPDQGGFVPYTQQEVEEMLDSGKIHVDDQQGLTFARRPLKAAEEPPRVITNENYQAYLEWVAGGRQGSFPYHPRSE